MVTGEVSQQISRLFIQDTDSKCRYLIDTGADISVFPATDEEKSKTPNTFVLYAANNTKIRTYGKKIINCNIGLRRRFLWSFIVADVTRPIIGSDFLKQYGLLVDVKNNCLVDSSTNLKTTGICSTPQDFTLKSVSYESGKFQSVLMEFVDVTIPSDKLPPVKHAVTHPIETTGSQVYAKPRRLSPEKLKIAKQEFEYMINLGICRPSKSSWSSPLHMVPKGNDMWRTCGDYRALNKITVPDRYPVPHIQDFAYMLAGKKIFSKIAVVKAYFQIPGEESDVIFLKQPS